MFKFFRKHRKLVMVALALCVLGLIFFGAGGSSFMASPSDVIAKVNGRKLTSDQFERVFRAMSRQQPEGQQQQVLGQALNELIRQEVLSEESKRYGLEITDEELRLHLAAAPAFQREGRFDPATYNQVVRRMFGMTPQEFETTQKKDILVRKLNLLVASAVHLSDAEIETQQEKVLESVKDEKARKELVASPEKLREAIRDRCVNLVFSDWLNRLNSDLNVSIVSDSFRQRLAGAGK